MKNETVRPITQGQLKDLAATLVGAIPELTFEDAKIITGHKSVLVSHVKKAFSNVLKLKSLTFTIRLMNDFDHAIRVGAYDNVYEEINAKNFPMTDVKIETVKTKLFDFKEYEFSTDLIIQIMKDEGYEPARIEHLLAFEAENPHSTQFITALGSSYYHPILKDKVYPAIWTVVRREDPERTLGWQQEWIDYRRYEHEKQWSKNHCFLGFCEL